MWEHNDTNTVACTWLLLQDITEEARKASIAGDKCKAKPQFYGEALTLDEMKDRYEQVQAKRQKQRASTKVTKKKASTGKGKQNAKSKKKPIQKEAHGDDSAKQAADHSDEEICPGCQKK